MTDPDRAPEVRSGAQSLAFGAALTALSISAIAHASATPQVLRAYRASDLEEVPEAEAEILWLLSVLTFASAPLALAWSRRVPAGLSRRLQAYAGAVPAGLAVVSLPVALHGRGLAGIGKLAQPIVGAAVAALVAAGRTRRSR